jgi:hypothetical protein
MTRTSCLPANENLPARPLAFDSEGGGLRKRERVLNRPRPMRNGLEETRLNGKPSFACFEFDDFEAAPCA